MLLPSSLCVSVFMHFLGCMLLWLGQLLPFRVCLWGRDPHVWEKEPAVDEHAHGEEGGCRGTKHSWSTYISPSGPQKQPCTRPTKEFSCPLWQLLPVSRSHYLLQTPKRRLDLLPVLSCELTHKPLYNRTNRTCDHNDHSYTYYWQGTHLRITFTWITRETMEEQIMN